MSSTSRNPSEPRAYTRESYSVDEASVFLDAQHGWQCSCAVFSQAQHCSHVERASVFRQMRGVQRGGDVLDLHLSMEEFQAMVAAEAAKQMSQQSTVDHAVGARVIHKARRDSVVFAAVFASVASFITYFAVSRSEPATVAAASTPTSTVAAEAGASSLTPSTVTSTPVPNGPVAIVNPFDRNEIFEFPAGTPESEARREVADVLLQRARDRLAAADAHEAQRYASKLAQQGL